MKKQEGLQRLTESERKIEKILSLDKITNSDIKNLTKKEVDRFNEIIAEKYRTLSPEEWDKFHYKIEAIQSEDAKNHLWEYNHNRITAAISNLMQEYGRMPSKTELASHTGLSRSTIHKHLKDYASHPQYMEQVEQFRFLTSKVLAKVFQFAVNGDIQAAKLYFSMVGSMNNGAAQNNTLIQNQNNYIQINGTVLSQESIKSLNPDQLNTIETILKTALPQKNISK